MSETEWLQCVRPYQMLLWLRGRDTERQWRSFAIRCCLLWEDVRASDRTTAALNAVQQFAAGKIDAAELRAANKSAWRTFDLTLPENAAINAYSDASYTDLAIMLTHKDAWLGAYCVSRIIRYRMDGGEAAQCDLLRDIFRFQANAGSAIAPNADSFGDCSA